MLQVGGAAVLVSHGAGVKPQSRWQQLVAARTVGGPLMEAVLRHMRASGHTRVSGAPEEWIRIVVKAGSRGQVIDPATIESKPCGEKARGSQSWGEARWRQVKIQF